MKKALSLALALVMCLGLTVPAFAAERTIYLDGYSSYDDAGPHQGEASDAQLSLSGDLELTGVVVLHDYSDSIDDYLCPVYTAAGPVTLKIMKGSLPLDIRTIGIDSVAYHADTKSYTTIQEDVQYFEGVFVYSDVNEQEQQIPISEFQTVVSAPDFWDKASSVPCVREGASAVLTTPGTYKVYVYYEAMEGGCIAFVTIPEAKSTEPENPTDTPDYQVSNWAKDRVALAVETGLAADSLGNDYRVDITRAQFAATAVKLYEAMSGEKVPAVTENPFTDTTDPVILQAASMGFVSGVGNGKFDPNALVTREQACVMLSSVFTKLGGEIPAVEATTFADNAAVAGWARNAVAFMNGKEIVTGIGDNNFGPKGNASIEQALLIALKMYENLK